MHELNKNLMEFLQVLSIGCRVTYRSLNLLALECMYQSDNNKKMKKNISNLQPKKMILGREKLKEEQNLNTQQHTTYL